MAESRPTIVIADDNADLAELIWARFTAHKWRTIVLNNGTGVHRAVLEAGRVDALVLDVEMPGRNGLEVLRTLRADPRTADLPILMLTGQRSAECVRAAAELGATSFLGKPFKVEELVRRVQALLDPVGEVAFI